MSLGFHVFAVFPGIWEISPALIPEDRRGRQSRGEAAPGHLRLAADRLTAGGRGGSI
jgi:hypothetical protein